MNFCSCMFRDTGYFGGYPNENEFLELRAHGIQVFVDLTTPSERSFLPFVYTRSYSSSITYINFPIQDNRIPKNKKEFLHLVQEVAELLLSGEKVYIHCKGGHGRSGVLVASLLCLLHNISPDHALRVCSQLHSKRPNLKQKWKHVQCPQMMIQQKFVMDIFRPMVVTYSDYHKYVSSEPQEFFSRLGIRPIHKNSPRLINELVTYVRDVLNQSKKIIQQENK